MKLVETTRNVKMEQEIPFETFQPENRPTFIDFPLFQGIFQWEEPDETFSIYCRSEISVACENIRFSSLFAAGDVSRSGEERLEKWMFSQAKISKISTIWKAPKVMACDWRISIRLVFLFQSSLLVIVIKGSEKSSCEGGF